MCSNDKKLEAALMMEKDVYDITYAFKDKTVQLEEKFHIYARLCIILCIFIPMMIALWELLST